MQEEKDALDVIFDALGKSLDWHIDRLTGFVKNARNEVASTNEVMTKISQLEREGRYQEAYELQKEIRKGSVDVRTNA